MNEKHKEIERKWLMEGFPPLEAFETREMEQGYLCFYPSTVRIRKSQGKEETNYKMTVKGQGTLTRTEVEFPIQKDEYESLRGLLIAPAARKTIQYYRLENHAILECSLVDEGEPTAFYYAEVEFPSEQQARDFVAPSFLGREVTQEPGYSMAAYCKRKGEIEQGADPAEFWKG